MGWGRRPTAAIFSSSKGSCWNTENLPDRRPIDGAAVTVDGRAEGMPFTKKKVEPGPYPPAAGKVNGWRYRVLDSGEVFVGTLPPSAGRDKRFKFRLTTYGDQAVDPEALGLRARFAPNACSFCPIHFGCICPHITAFRLVPCAFFDFAFRFVFICASFDAYTMRCIHRHFCIHSAFYGVHSQYIERTALHVIILHL